LQIQGIGWERRSRAERQAPQSGKKNGFEMGHARKLSIS
jgi:hypothetical protein